MKLTDPEIIKHLENGGIIYNPEFETMAQAIKLLSTIIGTRELASDDWVFHIEYFDFLEAVKRMDDGKICALNIEREIKFQISEVWVVCIDNNSPDEVTIEQIQSTKWYEVPE